MTLADPDNFSRVMPIVKYEATQCRRGLDTQIHLGYRLLGIGAWRIAGVLGLGAQTIACDVHDGVLRPCAPRHQNGVARSRDVTAAIHGILGAGADSAVHIGAIV